MLCLEDSFDRRHIVRYLGRQDRRAPAFTPPGFEFHQGGWQPFEPSEINEAAIPQPARGKDQR